MIHLVVDNTRPVPMAGLAANDDEPMLAAVVAFTLGRFVNRLASLSFWIVLGLIVGLML